MQASTSLSASARLGARLSASTLAQQLGPLPGSAAGPAYRALAYQMRGAVLDGRISVNTGLPSERELAGALAMSRTTVAAAYALLREEGWLDSRRGSGSRVTLPSGVRSGGAVPGNAGIFGYSPMAGHIGTEETIDLSIASLPAPAAAVQRAVAVATSNLAPHLQGDGYAPFGLPVLREAIAAHYQRAGVPTRPEEILVTSGAQHAFSLALQVFSDPGDRVLIECPTYPVALDAIRAAGRIPLPAPMQMPNDADGETDWNVDLLAATVRQSAPRLAYLIPDFQNPTGALMSTSQREAVIAACRASGTMLLIDESFRDVPFPSVTELPAPMAALGHPDRVICLGSVSKSFWGGLRIGWVRAAPSIIERLAVARALGDMSGPVIEQLITAELLADPTEALAVQRERLETGAAGLSAALSETVPDWLPTRPVGGSFLWVRLPGPFAVELARLAPSVGVRFAPGPRFGPDGTMASYIRLPFTAPLAQLVTGVSRLAAIAGQAAAARPMELPGWIA